jgi:hypothetical protein
MVLYTYSLPVVIWIDLNTAMPPYDKKDNRDMSVGSSGEGLLEIKCHQQLAGQFFAKAFPGGKTFPV